jgi:uncharacterized membrane protein YeaQ/YmgE (transglycosylase-associated protein family)
MLMGIAGWFFVGLIAGFIASKLLYLRGDDPRAGMVVGGLSAMVGGALFSMISGATVTGFNFHSILLAAAAALVGVVSWHITRHHSFSQY